MYIKNKKKLTNEEIKIELVRLLKIFIKFCDEHKLRYSITGGTLIGAIRHEGFIPWDDDIDVMMPRDDYNYLRENFKSETCHFTDNTKNRFYHFEFGKIISNNTWGFEQGYKKYNDYGVYLDIFPLDRVPVDERIYYEFLLKNAHTYIKNLRIVNNKKRFVWDSYCPKKKILKNIFMIPLSIIRFIWRRNIVGFRKSVDMNREMFLRSKTNNDFLSKKNYDWENNKIKLTDKYSFIFWGNFTYDMSIDIKEFNKPVIVKFEGVSCKAISGYDRFLWLFYKSDYMVLPPKNERNPVHNSHFYWIKKDNKNTKTT